MTDAEFALKILGLDIGTTTISAVVTENGAVLEALTKENGSFTDTGRQWEKIQDPEKICKTALSAVEELFSRFPDIERIGVTGQMHGIVYLDEHGNVVSPLYTWQDTRGGLPVSEDGRTYAQYLTEVTGYTLAAGYGAVTHAYNAKNGLVPESACVFCTIHDYIAMVLAGNTAPFIDPSDAASFGLFDAENGRFDEEAVRSAGIDFSIFPKLSPEPKIGRYRGMADVYCAIGDNQASFIGSVGHGGGKHMLVNVGTGSQFSVYSDRYITCEGLETRPFPGGGYLLVGASLCGGRAFALLERFFAMTGDMLGLTDCGTCYGAMDKLLEQGRPDDLPTVSPLFQGTRQDPTLRGSISGLTTENFTPLHLIWAMMEGMTDELYGMYESCVSAGVVSGEYRLIGSGNGLRKNPRLRECFAERFGRGLVMSDQTEEAATGAAYFAEMN